MLMYARILSNPFAPPRNPRFLRHSYYPLLFVSSQSRSSVGKFSAESNFRRDVAEQRRKSSERFVFRTTNPSASRLRRLPTAFCSLHPSFATTFLSTLPPPPLARLLLAPKRWNRVAVLRAGKNEVTVRNECKYSRFRIELSPWESANLIRPPKSSRPSLARRIFVRARFDARTDPGRGISVTGDAVVVPVSLRSPLFRRHRAKFPDGISFPASPRPRRSRYSECPTWRASAVTSRSREITGPPIVRKLAARGRVFPRR